MKLDVLTHQVYVVATNEARLHFHEYLTPEHFLYASLLFDMGKDIVAGSGGDVNAIMDDLQAFFETHIPTHTGDSPSDSFSFIQMLELAAAQARAMGRQYVTLAEFIAAIFFLRESFAQYILLKNGMDRLTMLHYQNRDAEELTEEAEAAPKSEPRPKKERAVSPLAQYTVDLCELARQNKLDPLVGREDILTRTVHVLCRRLKNNPVHVGDPGVGKTAVVEGLAQRIVAGGVPAVLRGASILRLDMGALVAGTKYRGDFEERMVKVLDEAAKLKNPILYIDEIHTVVGAGAVSGGGMDATSIIKPYLSRGDIRFIGSTTHEEYKKHFAKDRALARRFQRVDIDEPTQTECVQILQGLRAHYEKFHKVTYTDEILTRIVELSAKHMNDRFLPDKAVDVMDEAGVAARLEAAGQPEVPVGMEASPAVPVTNNMVEKTVARMAKIPPESMERDEVSVLSKLEEELNNAIFGQERAAGMITYAIKSARAGLNEPERPVASLLFVGPTGVGKTEIAKQLAKLLNIKLIRFDMSEYQEKHAVARLIGSPPGYVGYEEGGLLTEAVRKTPHAVLLLDEIEKAHGDIFNVLLQVMDYGNLTDNTGKKADFSHTIIIMTSNAGAREMIKSVIGFGGGTDATAVEKAVERIFSPEFRNRLDGVVPFNGINDAMAERIAQKALSRLSEKLAARGVTFTATREATQYIASKGFSTEFGAREIIRVVENDVKKILVDGLLFGKTAPDAQVVLDVKEHVFFLDM